MAVNEPAATRYIVLREAGVDDWRYWGECDAKGADGAIRKLLATQSEAAGTYVAVPARSWKPMRVEQVQTVQTVITAADETAPEKIAAIKTEPSS